MEKVQAGLWGIYRLTVFIVLASGYFMSSILIHWRTRDEVVRRRRFSENASSYCSTILKLFNFKIIVKNKPAESAVGLIVGNHMGFVDILVACSLMPTLFITSKEMHETPFLGRITEFGGCVYVERRSRSNILRELEDMVEYLRIGFRVALFPEATSHNGDEVLPFKRTLLTAAAYAGVPIIPYVFNFRSINNESFSLKNRDSVCYYGDIPFPVSLWSSFKLRELTCEIEFLDPVYSTPDDDRAVLAEKVRQMIVDKFVPVLRD